MSFKIELKLIEIFENFLDELDKTIAQYDETCTDSSDTYNSTQNRFKSIECTTPSKKKLLANDANAASIRTR